MWLGWRKFVTSRCGGSGLWGLSVSQFSSCGSRCRTLSYLSSTISACMLPCFLLWQWWTKSLNCKPAPIKCFPLWCFTTAIEPYLKPWPKAAWKGEYLAYISWWHFIVKESQCKNSRQEFGGVNWLAQPPFLYTPKPLAQGWHRAW